MRETDGTNLILYRNLRANAQKLKDRLDRDNLNFLKTFS
uniref:Uncharacterized protein n=1 Tax=Setaria viridis TaxID=4556 RepID=A0A4U6TMP5_SETVI|nr:hypothetical protein SEVIR_8G245433v2 [Setaria viridis]